MAAANAQIGVAVAAFYPSLTLSGAGGVESSAIKNLLDSASRYWSVGPTLSETIYDGGLRRATVNQYIAIIMPISLLTARPSSPLFSR